MATELLQASGTFLTGLAFLSAFVLGSAYLALLLRRLTPAPKELEHYPRVTILKPLKGVDEGLFENLCAIAEQDHPNFEIVFGVEDPRDEALEVAQAVKNKYPDVLIHLVTGGLRSGMNPKVRILRKMIPRASGEFILISDSNVRPPRDYVTGMQRRQAAANSDMVHSVLVGTDAHALGARLEELHLNTFVAASVNYTSLFGQPCVIGKSMLIRVESLRAVGGLAEFSDVLAEDYLMGVRFKREGFRVHQCKETLPVITGRAKLPAFLNRHIRWGQMRRWISPFFYCAEITANPVPLLLTAAALPGTPTPLLLGAVALKWLSDAVVYLTLSPEPSLKTLRLAPLRDALVFGIWFTAGLRRTISWRGTKMLVAPGSRLIPLEVETPSLERWVNFPLKRLIVRRGKSL